MILLSLLCRVLFFLIIFTSGYTSYYYAMLTGELPTIFKLLSVLYICKYKLNTFYVTKFQQAKPWVRWVIFMLETFAVIIPMSIQALNCTAVNNYLYTIY